MLEKYKFYENGPKHIITFKPNIDNAKYLYFIIDIEYTPYVTAADMGEIDKTEDDSDEINILALSKTRSYSIGLVKSQELYNNTEYFDDYFNALISSIFVHGRSINADEINYFDDDRLNQCLPTK